MLKYQIDSLDGLDEATQAFYEKSGDGYKLKIEGLEIPDVSGLKKKVDDLLAEKKAEQKARKEAEKKAADEAAEAAQKAGDVDAINASWQKKYEDGMAGIATERDDALSMLRLEKVHSKAVELATTLAVPGSADVLLPHIESRLSMDIVDGRAKAVVLDTAGKPSALTVDELGKEIANNTAFAPLIVASNAAGGGANGTNSGRAANQKTATRAEFDSWGPSQRSKFSIEGGQLTD